MGDSATRALLLQRQATHGDFRQHARLAQQLKFYLRQSRNWRDGRLSEEQRESIEMIVSKLARICTGDPNFPDHWDDIAGYATLPIAGGAHG